MQSSPFKLIGGRLTYFQQSPGPQLLFEVRKHEISVFVFQNRAELEQETGLQQRDLDRRRPPLLRPRRCRLFRHSRAQRDVEERRTVMIVMRIL
jgi:hypothetical protein